MDIRVIVPYFGKLPDYFRLFLKSCAYNPTYTFLLFTDQQISDLPANVHLFQMPFKSLQARFRNRLTGAAPQSPYKLCDYKPAYGYLFSEYLEGADYWGYCDTDLIFGKIDSFLPQEKIVQYEKLQTQGHFTLFRNCDRVNTLFLRPLSGGISFRQAVSIPEPCFFDEIFFPVIARREGVLQCDEQSFADILPQYDDFRIAPSCSVKDRAGQRFFWENGVLYQCAAENEKERTTLLYIHLQKRRMPMYLGEAQLEKLWITPQGFYSQETISDEAFHPDTGQAAAYQKKRWSGFTLRKVWVKYKICSVRMKNR